MRILFTTQATPSHLFPLLPLASAARTEGHDVAFATGSRIAEPIRRLGFTYFQAGKNMDDPEIAETLRAAHTRGLAGQRAYVVANVFGGLLPQYFIPDLLQVFDHFRPDLIVSETTEPAGPALAELHDLTAATVLFGLLPEDLEEKLGMQRSSREQLGLPPVPTRGRTHRLHTLAFASRSYQLPNIALPADISFCRPSPPESAPGEVLPPWFAELRGRPLVYGSLGTVSAFNAQPGALRMVIDAIAACDLPDVVGLVTCGDNQDPASFGPLPKNVRVVNFIPQALLLPHCRAVVCHGGYGTTMGALSFGVPLVITPLGADQPQHAGRCQALGVGEMLLPDQVTLPALTAALSRVLHDPGYTQRARAFRAELEALPDAAAAVRLLVSEAAR